MWSLFKRTPLWELKGTFLGQYIVLVVVNAHDVPSNNMNKARIDLCGRRGVHIRGGYCNLFDQISINRKTNITQICCFCR